MADMCPHCGEIVTCGEDGLTPYHDWPRPARQVCPGSKQHPRCAESDARPLWNGKVNPHFSAWAEDPVKAGLGREIRADIERERINRAEGGLADEHH